MKNVADLLNLIYDANTDNQIIKRTNRTIYETVFDLRNIGENDDVINKSNIIHKNEVKKSPGYQKLKQKLGKLMRGLVESNNINNNNNLKYQYNIYDNNNNNLEQNYNINNNKKLEIQNSLYDNNNNFNKQYNNYDSNYEIIKRNQNNIYERVNKGQQPFSIDSDNNLSLKTLNEYGSNFNNNLYNNNLDLNNLSEISAINKDMRVTKVSKIVDINHESLDNNQNNINNDLNSNYQKNYYNNYYNSNSQINKNDYSPNINYNNNKYVKDYNRGNESLINNNNDINNFDPKDNEKNKDNYKIRKYDYNLYINQNDKKKINDKYNKINNYNNYNNIKNKYINNNISDISPQKKTFKKHSWANVIKINDDNNEIQSFDNNINNNDVVNQNIAIQTDLNDLNKISNIPYSPNINNYNYKKSIEKEKINNNAKNEIIESDNFQILRDNDMNNNLDKTEFNNNEINKEISLDYSYISKEEPKEEEYKKTTENSFSINKTKKIKRKKMKDDKSPNSNRKTKNKVNVKKKDTSFDKKKPKINYKIDVKELIKMDAIEKSLLTPSKRYQNQTGEKKKTKKEAVKYNQPFKFNLYEDF